MLNRQQERERLYVWNQPSQLLLHCYVLVRCIYAYDMYERNKKKKHPAFTYRRQSMAVQISQKRAHVDDALEKREIEVGVSFPPIFRKKHTTR